jgi:hypothetical protein
VKNYFNKSVQNIILKSKIPKNIPKLNENIIKLSLSGDY